LSGKMANKTIPVACGKSYTQKYVTPFPELWRQEADTLAGISLPLSSRRPLAVPAERVIQELVEKQAKLGVKPIIIALGPLTTIANLLDKDPNFKTKISHVISMGGAVSVKGNIHYIDPSLYQNRVSEWNYYADPLAAKRVIESGVAFKMIPLDATDTVPLNQEFMNTFKRMKRTRIAEFIYSALNKRNQIEQHAGYCFWDCLTVAMAFDESIGSFKSLPIKVKYGDPKISGQTVVDHQNGRHIQVALRADPKRFHQDFLEVVNR
jgi:inosine-uridine nucleoside N-ribohydrolase